VNALPTYPAQSLFPSMQKWCLYALFHFFTCSSFTKNQIVSDMSKILRSKIHLISGKHKDIPAVRQPCQGIHRQWEFSTAERTLTKLECTFLIVPSVKGQEKSL